MRRRDAIEALAVWPAACSLVLALASCGQLPAEKSPSVPGGPASRTQRQLSRPPLAGKVEAPARGAYLGVYVPPAPFDITSLDSLETSAGKKVSIVMWYQPWAAGNRSRFDAGACVAVMRRGKVPMISWEPWDPGTEAHALVAPAEQPAYRLAAISGGKYDAYIAGWARQIRDLGGPVMLRPMHEMNGNWYPWAGTVNGNVPRDYVSAWRHVHDIFIAEGATNVTWVWSVNGNSVPDTPANAFSAYYPGDAYVDWTAISAFNRGVQGFHPLSELCAGSLAYLKTLRKPICIAEFGTVEKGGDKAAWLTGAYGWIAANESIKAAIYYDAVERARDGTRDWRLDSSPASLDAFRQATAPRYFTGAPPAALSRWADSLTLYEWERLLSYPAVY